MKVMNMSVVMRLLVKCIFGCLFVSSTAFVSCSFIPGSTRVPGSSRPKSTVRTIKTYAQRLQEMKHIPAAGKSQIQWRYTTDSGGMDSAAINCLLMHIVCSGLFFCKT